MDNVFVVVVASVQYRAIKDSAYEAFYKLTNPKSQIQSYVFDVVRASVPKMLLNDVFENKSKVAKNVETELEKAMGTYGFEIVQTLIVDIKPDPSVKRAMNEINASSKNSTVFIPHGPGHIKNVADQICNGLLQGHAGQQ